MRIKRVEIIGFKSFCDRAVVQIGESITGVVGPNGCGKSNIVDAIRWCMGEQSAKHLRGKAMEDVIFGGSESRGPAPMAEVSLTFDDVGFSHEALEVARHSDEASAEQALEAIDAIVPDGEADPDPDEVPEPVGETTGTWLDAEGNRIASPAEEVAKILEDQPPVFDFAHYTEVTITRRLYRDGVSQYFINKTPCRLRDITDFFLGTGVGTKAYAIIEQGRIGQIVSSRPQDRRAIIEEAAGITKFKAKKKAAERKLDQTRQNLMRVSDIVAELDKRMGTLRRQAQKAERYRKYKAEVKDIELWKAAHRWLELAGESQLVGGRLGTARVELEDVRAVWAIKDAHVVAERAELAVEERRLVGVQELVYELENRIRLGDSKIGFERREAEELDGRIAVARAEIDEVSAKRELGANELAARSSELAALEAEVSEQRAALAAREAATGEAKQMLSNAQGKLDEARAELGVRRTEIATADAQLEALARRRDEASRRLERVLAETDQHTTRVKDLEREGRRVDGALAELRQTRLDLGSQSDGFESRHEVLANEVARGESEVEALRTELHRRRSRLVSLQEIEERYEGFARGTRAVMQQAESISDTHAIRGVVADMVRAPELLEIAVEAALGDRLGGILVSEPEVGFAAIGFLKQGGGGRSAFVSLTAPRLRADKKASRLDEAAPLYGAEALDDVQLASVARESNDQSLPTPSGGGSENPSNDQSLPTPSGGGSESPYTDQGLSGGGSEDPNIDQRVAADAVSRFEGEGNPGSGEPAESIGDGSVSPGGERRGVIEFEDRTQLVAAHAAIGGEGVLGRMADLVGFAEGYEQVGKRLLGGTVVVDDLRRALDLHVRGVTDRLVTLDGDVVDEDGVVAGGSRDAQGAGVLAQKREIRDLHEIVGRLEHDLSEAMTRLVTAKTELKQVAKAIEGLKTQVHEGDVAIMGHEKDDARVRGELERHRDRLGQLGTEQLELEERLGVIAADDHADRERRTYAEQRIAELERVQLDLIAEVTTHRDQLEELAHLLTHAQIRAAQLGEKRAAAEAATLRLQRSDGELASRAERLAAEIDDAVRRVSTLREGCDQLAAELAVVREAREGEARTLDEGRIAYQVRLTTLTEVELAVRELRSRADRLSNEVGQLELRNGQIAMTRQVVEDQISERYQLEVQAIVHEFHLRAMITEVEEARLAELRELIERMGTDINLTAIEEFAEVSQRFEFLAAQRNDLDRAVDQLQRAIDKINRTSRKLFKDTFAAVNATFKEVFPRLFRGGHAALSLSGGDDVDLLEAGVEIMAQPPGKKNTTVEQLSGGEKALTAVALVFSIFLIKPSPFCILDEVDAPLDEANVDRYNELVREMTDRSQFIVITHNKRTMEAADNLYGVTMQEPGVSKLVSVNLNKLGRPAVESKPSAGVVAI